MYSDRKAIIKTMLYAYPDICLDKKQREDYALAMAASGNLLSEHVDGSSNNGQACDHYIDAKDNDKQYQYAKDIIDKMLHGFERMSREDYLAIKQIYFEHKNRDSAAAELNMSSASIDRKIDHALWALQDACSEAYNSFCQWRKSKDKERRDIMTSID